MRNTMKMYMGKILPLMIVLLMVAILLPQAFASDVDSDLSAGSLVSDINSDLSDGFIVTEIDSDSATISEDSEIISEDSEIISEDELISNADEADLKDDLGSSSYDYETSVSPNALNYVNGSSQNVTVTEEYGEGVNHFQWYHTMYAWVNGEGTYTMVDFNHSSSSFTVDLKDLSSLFVEGENTVVFHPSSYTVNQVVGSNYHYNPLTVNVEKGQNPYDYETFVSPDNLNYNIGDSVEITVSAAYDSDEDFSGVSWKYYLNGDEEGVEIEGTDSMDKTFTFNLMDICDKLVEGENTIYFHPNQGTLEALAYFTTFNYHPLTVNAINEEISYDYETSVYPSEVDYVIGEHFIVEVSASFDSLGRLEEGDAHWKYYLNGDENGVVLNDFDAILSEFEFDLFKISDKLIEGQNIICFHPNQGTLEAMAFFTTFNYNPLIINVGATSNYDYETKVNPSNVNYTKGDNLNVTVTAIYESDEVFSDVTTWKYYLNGDEVGVAIDGTDAIDKYFIFDLAAVSDQLLEGENTIIFHPNQGTLENLAHFSTFKYNPLTINVSLAPSSEYDYETTVIPSELDYAKGEAKTIDVTAVYEDESAFDFYQYDAMYIYINGVEYNLNAITGASSVNQVHAGDKAFSLNLALICDYLNDGINTIVFHPDNRTLSQAIGSGKYKFNPLTLNVTEGIPEIEYLYNSTPAVASVNYIIGESVIVEVNVEYPDYYDLSGSYIYVYIDGSSEGIQLVVDSEVKSFSFDLKDLAFDFEEGKSYSLVFRPPEDILAYEGLSLEDCNLLPLTVNVPGSPVEEEFIYVSTVGDDDNEGTYESPVSTITRAIEIVKETGINNIRILEGTYYEYAIYLDVSCNIYGVGDVVIDAESLDRIFFIEGHNEVKLANLTLINGNAPVDGYAEDATHGEISFYAAGGAVFINDTYVEMDNMTFIDNYAEHFGGAINVEADNFKISNSKFMHNFADIFGGAIDLEGDNVHVFNCTFVSNDAANGGAIGSFAYNVTIANSTFENNTAESGGAVYIDNMPDAENANIIENNSFIHNNATQQGGAINVENYGQIGVLWEYTKIMNNEFRDNYGYNGGAIAAYYGDTASLDNIFVNNSAGYGGAIASITVPSGILDNTIGKLYLRNNTIINCTAEEAGDGIYNLGYIDSRLNIVFLDGNTIRSDGEAVILNVTVSDDMGNPISGSPLNFTVDGKATINQASDLVDGLGTVRFIPRENGTFVVSGIYFKKNDMYGWHNVVNGTLIVENAIADYFGIIYVSSENGDDDNTGTIDSPVKTFNQGFLLATRENGSMEMVVYSGTYEASNYKLTKSFKVTGIGNPVLDAKHQGAIFVIEGDYDNNFTFTGLTFINGVSSKTPSGFNRGGAIFIKGGNLCLENDTFKSNSAEDGGGAIYANKGFSYSSGGEYPAYALIKNCIFESNYGKEGGAIGLYDCKVDVINSTFTNNKASNGGAIAMGGNIIGGIGNLTVIGSIFNNNAATDTGGAILGDAYKTYDTRYYLVVENSSFRENTAVYGGAICGGDANISSCVFIDNKANNEGGAVLLKDNESFIRYSIFSNNNANNGTQYCGNSSLINCNFWGLNYGSMEELLNQNVISIGKEISPFKWVNIKIEGKNIISLGDSEYLVKFVANDGSDLDHNMPNHSVSISNRDSTNIINCNVLEIANNTSKFIYSANRIANDAVSIYNKEMYADNLICSFGIMVKNETGDENGTDNGTDDTIGDSKELQELINNASSSGVLDLGKRRFENISNINITSPITIIGGIISSDNSGNPIFVADSNAGSFKISNATINVNDNDVIVKLLAQNDTNPNLIDTAEIIFNDNTVSKANDDVDASTVTVIEIESDRMVLNSNSTISVEGNMMPEDINIVKLIKPGSHSNSTSNRMETVIDYSNMTTTAVDVDTDGRVGKYFIITLKDKNGNAVTNKAVSIGFNGNVYNRVTDSKGQAKLQINLKGAGTYTFAVAYLGDDKYNGSFVVAKIVVKKQTGKLQVPNKTYKASAKTKAISVTFKSASGKLVKGKKVKVTVNGKTYAATTNAKGVAKVNVSLNKKGTYSVVTKFAGDKTYNAITKKSKIVIS